MKNSNTKKLNRTEPSAPRTRRTTRNSEKGSLAQKRQIDQIKDDDNENERILTTQKEKKKQKKEVNGMIIKTQDEHAWARATAMVEERKKTGNIEDQGKYDSSKEPVLDKDMEAHIIDEESKNWSHECFSRRLKEYIDSNNKIQLDFNKRVAIIESVRNQNRRALRRMRAAIDQNADRVQEVMQCFDERIIKMYEVAKRVDPCQISLEEILQLQNEMLQIKIAMGENREAMHDFMYEFLERNG